MHDIEAVVFDLDETLVTAPDYGPERLAAAFDRAGVEPFFTIEDFARWMPKVEGENPLDLRLRCFRGIAEETGHPVDDADAVARAFEMPAPREFEPVSGATALVRTLRDRGYDLALVTNGPEAKQRAKLELLDLDGTFDAAVFGDTGCGVKPEPGPLEHALAALGAPARSAVNIGDRVEVDLEPAAALGMATVWIPPGGVPEEHPPAADHVVGDLETLHTEPWAGA